MEAKEVFSLKPQTSNLKHFYAEQHFLPLPWRERERVRGKKVLHVSRRTIKKRRLGKALHH